MTTAIFNNLEALCLEARYLESLEAIPAPGTGCHPALLGAATLGIMAGRDDVQLLSDIRASIPPGTRKVADREITDAIKRARLDTLPGKCRLDARRTVPQTSVRVPLGEALKDANTAAKLRAHVIEAGGGDLNPDDPDLWEASPAKLHHGIEADAVALLENLYRPDDLVFIGKRSDKSRDNIHAAAVWAKYFRDAISWILAQPQDHRLELFARLGDKYPLIMLNPLTGQPAPTASGDKMTLRGDNCVKAFRFFLIEFDGPPMEKQGGILRGLCRQYGFRPAALIFSGSKSLHAWIIAEGIETREAWREIIQGKLFPVLAALGVDSACKNPSRLSRLPGMFRRDSGNWQRLFWLAPEGGAL